MRLIDDNQVEELEKRLQQPDALEKQGAACWGEGILAGASNQGNRAIVELLMRYGARVPDVSKWGRYYYFKHTEIARLIAGKRHESEPYELAPGTTLLQTTWRRAAI